jgi:hypothetical protein
VGAEFAYQVLTTRGSATRWSATGLPPGLRIDPSTGIISGVPTAAGDFDRVVITATNAFGRSSSVVYLLNVEALPMATLGSFTGLIDRTGSGTGGLGARFDLTTTANSTYTARVTIGKKSYPLRGVIDSSTGDATGAATINANGVALALAFTVSEASGAVSGSLAGALLEAWPHQALPNRVGICHFFAYANNLPDDQPQGASFGTLRLPAKGLARIAGRTADGSRFASSSAVSIAGHVVIYQALYQNPGSLHGRLNLADDLPQTVTGQLSWSKPSQTSGTLYRAGWADTLNLNAFGGRYRPAAGATLPLDAPPSTGENALLGLQDGGIEAFGSNPAEFGVRFISTSRLVAAAPLRLKVNNKTGVISGKAPLTQAGVSRSASLFGLLIPAGDPATPFATIGYGYFVLPTAVRGTSRSGLLVLDTN